MATVPFEFECDVSSSFVMDPNAHPRVGYVTALDGFGLPAVGLKADLTVNNPVAGHTIAVAGVLEKLSWDGSVGGLLKLGFWISPENAALVRVQQQATFKDVEVDKLNWWIADYDQETKVWFEQSYPSSASPVSGTIVGKDNPALDVALTGTQLNGGIMVYKITIEVAPPANQQYALHFANSPTKKVVKSWGLQTGTLAP